MQVILSYNGGLTVSLPPRDLCHGQTCLLIEIQQPYTLTLG